jgi:hypothetical protein
MSGIERDLGGTRLTVAWAETTRDPTEASADQARRSLEQAADYATALVERLVAAGHRPASLGVALRRGRLGVLELLVRGEVADLSEAEFIRLAKTTLNAPASWQHGAIEPVVLWARLQNPAPPPVGVEPLAPALDTRPDVPRGELGERKPTTGGEAREAPASGGPKASGSGVAGGLPPPILLDVPGEAGMATEPPPDLFEARPTPVAAEPPRPEPPRRAPRAWPLGKVAIGLLVGLALGVVGLPRLLGEQPFGPPPTDQPTPDPRSVVVQPTLSQTAATPTLVSALPTATLAAAPTPAATAFPTPMPPLFAERFVTPLAGWPNNPQGTAWFADGAFRMFARQPGRFVTVGVPLRGAVGDAVISAQFHKVSGPPGGGYGLIVRDQGASQAADTSDQPGEYIVLEVGDRGEIGIWQRAETRWIDILGWTHSDAVHPDREPNVLAATLHQQAVQFQVNGEVVANVLYSGLPPSGGVGVFTGGDLNEVALEWLRIEALHN